MAGVTDSTRRGFSKRLAALRSEQSLTQIELGKKVGVTGTCIWNWESGNTFPRSGSMAKLAKALRTTADYLTTGAVSPPSVAKVAGIKTGARPLSEVINDAREAVAESAGISISKVRIVLDWGD